MNTYKTWRLIALILIGIMLLVCGLTAVGASSPVVPDKLLTAMHQVEANGKVGPILGDNGKALGPLQIHRGYWQDSGVRGSYSQCTNLVYAKQVVTAYMNRYGRRFVLAGDYQSLARIHNGGPNGYRNASTLAYWKKVQKALDK